jgi:lipoprotein-anchoring transpeptidase ErfK/SrfK
MMNRLFQFALPCIGLFALNACSTVTEMFEANIPNRQTGPASIVISLRAQEAYLYRGKVLVASSRISSGREGHRTPIGRFRVIRKDIDHTSGLYGDYVSASGQVVVANVDTRRVRKPPGTHYVGAPMPYFLEFSPGYGLHQGYLPGEPASHGCIRMPYWKARQFFQIAQVGTPVWVKP